MNLFITSQSFHSADIRSDYVNEAADLSYDIANALSWSVVDSLRFGIHVVLPFTCGI